MDEAIKEDRERFFIVADTLQFQPKYKEQLEELEQIKQEWRDMTRQTNYPHIKWPLKLPNWFPDVKFASYWNEDYLQNTLQENENVILER